MGFWRSPARDSWRYICDCPKCGAPVQCSDHAGRESSCGPHNASSNRESCGMTQPTATCPNCGAQVVFRWSSSVQTVCEYCKSILVRTDVDLKKVGEVADLPPDSSPIQIGTEGSYNHKGFVAIGRIVYEYELGSWNEWHLMLNDG